jgi:hypothetical protein
VATDNVNRKIIFFGQLYYYKSYIIINIIINHNLKNCSDKSIVIYFHVKGSLIDIKVVLAGFLWVFKDISRFIEDFLRIFLSISFGFLWLEEFFAIFDFF